MSDADALWRRRGAPRFSGNGTFVKTLEQRDPIPSHKDGWASPPPVTLADTSRIHLYKDGEALQASYRAIEAAQQSIRLETYMFRSDHTGRRFADLLISRAREGVDVRVMYDALGSLLSSGRMFADMQDAGVAVRPFHPLRLASLSRAHILNRDHRKLLIVDDEKAVVGGQNLGDEYGSSWVSDNNDVEEWRDTAVGVHGPAVRLLCDAFERIWHYTEHGGRIEAAQFFQVGVSKAGGPSDLEFPARPKRRRKWRKRPPQPGPSELAVPPDTLAVLGTAPTRRSPLLDSLKKLLRDARESIDLTMGYFAPPDLLVDQLCQSARNGVRVRLMLPSKSDVPLLVVAARAFYEQLLAAGVQIHERRGAVLHAKTLCVDSTLSIVGSTNLDYRSMHYNAELSLVINSTEFASRMSDLFEHDVRHADRIHGSRWRHRPVRDRLMQWIVKQARALL